MRPKVAITTATFSAPNAPALERLLAAGLEVLGNPHRRKLSEAESCDLLGDASGVLAGTSPLSRTVLSAAPSLRVISRVGVGIDSVDVRAASEAGISVFVAAGTLPQSVAELTIGLMLDVLRRVSEADRQLRSGTWAPLMGGLLGGRTVGIVGLGSGRVQARLPARTPSVAASWLPTRCRRLPTSSTSTAFAWSSSTSSWPRPTWSPSTSRTSRRCTA